MVFAPYPQSLRDLTQLLSACLLLRRPLIDKQESSGHTPNLLRTLRALPCPKPRNLDLCIGAPAGGLHMHLRRPRPCPWDSPPVS